MTLFPLQIITTQNVSDKSLVIMDELGRGKRRCFPFAVGT